MPFTPEQTTLRPEMLVPIRCRGTGEFEGHAILDESLAELQYDGDKRWRLWMVKFTYGEKVPVPRWVEDGSTADGTTLRGRR